MIDPEARDVTRPGVLLGLGAILGLLGGVLALLRHLVGDSPLTRRQESLETLLAWGPVLGIGAGLLLACVSAALVVRSWSSR